MSNKQYKYGFVLTGNSQGAVKALRDVDGGYNRSSKSASRFAKNNQSVVKSLKALVGINVAAYAASFVGSTINNAKTTVDFADKVQKLNIGLGISTEALSQYSHVANLTGISFEQLTTGFKMQAKNISEAASGTGEAVKVFEQLGLSASELKNLAPEKQFDVLADALDGVASQSDKVQMAMKIWGRSGADLLQTINGGSVAIRSMMQEADQLGLTITNNTANAMAGLNDSFARVDAASTGMAINLLTKLGPAIENINQFLIDNMDTIGNVTLAFLSMGQPIGYLFDGVSALTSAMIDYYPVVITTTALMYAYSTATTTATVSNAAYGASFGSIKKGFMLLSALMAGWAIGTYLREQFVEVRLAGIAMVNGLMKSINYLQSGFEMTWAAIKLPFDLLITHLQTKMSELVGYLAGVLDSLPDVVVPDGWVDSMRSFETAITPAETAMERFNNTIETASAELIGNNASVDSVTDAMVDYELSLKKSDKELDKNNKKITDFSKSQLNAGKATSKTTKDIKKQISTFGELAPAIEKYEELILGVTREKRQLEEDLWDAETLYQAGIIKSIDALDQYKQKLNEVYNESTNVSDKKIITQVTQTADPFFTAWENGFKRLDDAGAEFWQNLFSGAENSLDGVQDMLQNWLAEMAHTLLTKPLMMNIQGMFLGTPGGGGQSGIMSQLSGGQGGGFSGLSNNMTSSLNTFGASYFGAPAGSASEFAAFNSVPFDQIGNHGITGSVTGSTGGLGGFAQSGMGGLLAGYGGAAMTGNALSGAAMGVGQIGLMGGVSGLASGAGFMSGAGAALGAMGPVGWAALAIGALAGSGMFSGKGDRTPDLNVYTNKSANTTDYKGLDYFNDGAEDNGSYDPHASFNGRFNNFSFSTKHDAFSSAGGAQDFVDGVTQRYNALEEIIYKTFGEAESQRIHDAMSAFNSGRIKNEDFGGMGDFDSIFEGMITRIFQGVGNVADAEIRRFEGVYLRTLAKYDSLELALSTVAAIKESTETDTERSFSNIESFMHIFISNAADLEQQMKELAAATQLISLESINDDFALFMSDANRVMQIEISKGMSTEKRDAITRQITADKNAIATAQQHINTGNVRETLATLGDLDKWIEYRDSGADAGLNTRLGYQQQIRTLTDHINALNASILNFVNPLTYNAQQLLALGKDLLSVNNILTSTRQSAYDLTIAGAELARQLANGAGGIDALKEKVNFYYQNYFSANERSRDLIAGVQAEVDLFNVKFTDLGQITAGSTQSLRDFIESLDLTTTAGIDAYNAALNFAPALSEGAKALDALALSVLNLRQSSTALAERYDDPLALQNLTNKWDANKTGINDWLDGLVTKGLSQSAIDGYKINGTNVSAIDKQLSALGLFVADNSEWLYEMYGDDFVASTTAFLAEWANDSKRIMSLSGIDELGNLITDSTTTSITTFTQNMINAGDALLGFVHSMTVGQLSPLSPTEQLKAAGGIYDDYFAQVEAGDLNAVSGLTSAAQSYLTIAQGMFASSKDYTAIYNNIYDNLKNLGLELGGSMPGANITGGPDPAQLLPSYAVGTGYVQGDQLAQIHNAEMVIDAQTAAQLRKYGIAAGNGQTNVQSNDDIIKELRDLKAEMQSLKKINAAGFKGSIKESKRNADVQDELLNRERIS